MTSEAAIESRAGLLEIDGEQFYMIDAVDRMPPFLMSLVSDGDRWMFTSSSGGTHAGLLAGRAALIAKLPRVHEFPDDLAGKPSLHT